ncbi:MAG TPA: methylisocitrate lyase [Candidatus Dormibacteraeota bacterium]|nr:methylisocitrate lyase [Candidatus Dormibacteraeota bacterium]
MRSARHHKTAKLANLFNALAAERPLQVPGVIHAYAAVLAERAGFKALYLSGAGVANASYGVPDIGITTLDDVLIDVKRITSRTKLPLLVDADTGWGNPRNTVREMNKAGAAGVHIEDQVEAKKCGHLGGKKLVSAAVMARRIESAVSGKKDRHFVVMARTDAVASEGLAAGIDRARKYRDAGADMIFAEALSGLEQYREFVDAVRIPVLANITEFGKTPLFTVEQLGEAGVSLALYPLSAFRAMNAAALKVYQALRAEGTQKNVVPLMQTRAELYEILGYEAAAKSR